jgi:hypothetical protein
LKRDEQEDYKCSFFEGKTKYEVRSSTGVAGCGTGDSKLRHHIYIGKNYTALLLKPRFLGTRNIT